MGYFSRYCHWPAAGADLRVGGVSFVEMLILFELWAGERLVLEKAVLDVEELDAQFQCRQFLLVIPCAFFDLFLCFDFSFFPFSRFFRFF